MAWQEVSFEKGNDDAASLSTFHSKALNLLICFLGIGALCLIHVSYILFPCMVASEYMAVKEIIPLTILSACLGVLSSFFGQIYAALKKTTIIMYSTIAAALVNVVCMQLFISWWSLKGVVLSLIASYFVNVWMRVFMIRKHLLIRIDYTFLLLFAGLLTVSLLIFYAGGWMINLFGIMLFFGAGLLYQREFAVALLRKTVGNRNRNHN
jgi:O-antigen/teichoic acid export membrane protein